MRNKAFRREKENKELEKRIELCKNIGGYDEKSDFEYIRRKRDLLHSYGSNYWNSFENKSVMNKKERHKLKKETMLIENEYKQ